MKHSAVISASGSHCTLVGAGPGDPELLTLKAVRAIARATVLLVDDLVNDAVLEHAKPDARIIHVGKRGGCASTPQAFIHKLMVQAVRSPEMLKSAADSAGLTTLLDQLISIDSIRQFKTHPKADGLASEVLGIPPEELLFVSSNAWDALGATWYGFVTCWINRANLPFEKIGPRPSFVASDLKQVLNIVELA